MKQLRPLILASGSPRRKELLTAAGAEFTVVVKKIDETFPETLPLHEVAKFLAEKKSAAYDAEVSAGNFVITADTIVYVENSVLNKPSDPLEATAMLKLLSGKIHSVITGVCLRGPGMKEVFQSETLVTFRDLTDKEIQYYIEHYKPFDKAGAYGIQEWIGLTGIERIDGSYFNVVGLPVAELFEKLIFHKIISIS